LRLGIEPLKCIACAMCESVCSLKRDSALTQMSSSMILHVEDKADYFGLVLKTVGDGLVVARPEGGSGDQSASSSGPGAKPILLREPCDLCGGEPRCSRICPTGCISVVD
jgi:ferredoxin